MKQMKYIWVQVVKKDEMAIWIFLDRKSNFGYLNGYWKSSWIAQVPTSIIENRNPSMLPLTNGLFQLLDDKSCYDFLKKTTTTLMKKVMSSKNLWNAFTAFFVSLNARNNCYTLSTVLYPIHSIENEISFISNLWRFNSISYLWVMFWAMVLSRIIVILSILFHFIDRLSLHQTKCSCFS